MRGLRMRWGFEGGGDHLEILFLAIFLAFFLLSLASGNRLVGLEGEDFGLHKNGVSMNGRLMNFSTLLYLQRLFWMIAWLYGGVFFFFFHSACSRWSSTLHVRPLF